MVFYFGVIEKKRERERERNDVLTQTAFLSPTHSDQQNWDEGGIALRTLCTSSGNFFKCANGSRCAASRLCSR